jgi:hypothetical protein
VRHSCAEVRHGFADVRHSCADVRHSRADVRHSREAHHKVTVGLEATGNSHGFMDAGEFGHEVWIGDAARIGAVQLPKQRQTGATQHRFSICRCKNDFHSHLDAMPAAARSAAAADSSPHLLRMRALVKTELQHLAIKVERQELPPTGESSKDAFRFFVSNFSGQHHDGSVTARKLDGGFILSKAALSGDRQIPTSSSLRSLVQFWLEPVAQVDRASAF